jgi:ubiquitin C-terminal hydrolase
MKTKGFCYKLQDTNKTMFITNLDTSDSVKIGIIDFKYDGLYNNAKLDNEFVIPRKDFIKVCQMLNDIAEDMKQKEQKESKFIVKFEEELTEKKKTSKKSKGAKNEK